MPKLSIVIATYNTEATLQKCLHSICSQSYSDWELIIIDGASTDKTVEIIKSFSSLISYWHSKSDSGIYDAWNQGIAQAKGEYICFIGADDFFPNANILEMIFNDIQGIQYDLITSKGNFLRTDVGTNIVGKPWDFKSVEKRLTVCHPGLLHHHCLFEKYGRFDQSYKIVGDYEFLLRLPKSIKTLHVDFQTISISDGGISRKRMLTTLKERKKAQASCPRIGWLKANIYYIEKLLKIPIAFLLKIPV